MMMDNLMVSYLLCFILILLKHSTIFTDMRLIFIAVTTRRQSIVDGMRTIALKLEFGVSRNQIFERFSHFHHAYILFHVIDHFAVILHRPCVWLLHSIFFWPVLTIIYCLNIQDSSSAFHGSFLCDNTCYR